MKNKRNNKTLDQRFEEAYERASSTKSKLTQDEKLRLYAYYKHATKANISHIQQQSLQGTELVSAFKLNSLFQVKNLSQKEAKKKYIDLVNKIIPKE